MTYLPYLVFFIPIILTLVIYALDKFNGWKTNLNSFSVALIGGYATLDLSWLPVGIVAPLATGFAVSALLSNTLLTKRV